MSMSSISKIDKPIIIRAVIILFTTFGGGGVLPAMAGDFVIYDLMPNKPLVFKGQRQPFGFSFKEVLKECTVNKICAVSTFIGRELTDIEKEKINKKGGKVLNYTPPNGLRGGYSVVGPDNAGDKPKVNKGDKKGDKPKVNKGDKKGDKPKKPTNINKKK
jgi:hypothetical protein